MTSDEDYRRGRHVVSKLHVHLVFVTKYRRRVLTQPMLDRMGQVFEEVCKQFDAELVEFNGEHDHVHLLVEYPPKHAISTLVNSLKGVSSRRIRQEFDVRTHQDHLWSPSYFAASAGGAPIAVIKKYIENQKSPGQDDNPFFRPTRLRIPEV